MAPEQVRGLVADTRADIFSFGAILYEMLSGTRAFKGETPADTLSAILTVDPPEIAKKRRTDMACDRPGRTPVPREGPAPALSVGTRRGIRARNRDGVFNSAPPRTRGSRRSATVARRGVAGRGCCSRPRCRCRWIVASAPVERRISGASGRIDRTSSRRHARWRAGTRAGQPRGGLHRGG